jgi:hypothetical protein
MRLNQILLRDFYEASDLLEVLAINWFGVK